MFNEFLDFLSRIPNPNCLASSNRQSTVVVWFDRLRCTELTGKNIRGGRTDTKGPKIKQKHAPWVGTVQYQEEESVESEFWILLKAVLVFF